MIVDASAIVAILAGEPFAESSIERLRLATLRLTHAVSVYEAVLAMSRLNRIPAERALADVEEFLSAAEFGVVALDGPIVAAAIDAFARFGRGRHPARLNMGDCFSYACAKLRGMPLLYKGEDFARTDLG